MWGSHLERLNDEYLENESKRKLEEQKAREAAERIEIDRAYPSETEKTPEELLEVVPSNIRRQLERAKSVLGGEKIDPADRTAFVADTLELLHRYLFTSWRKTPDQVDYAFRKNLYGITHSKAGWQIPLGLRSWLGTDAEMPDVRARVQDVYLDTARSSYATWLATNQVVRAIFPGGGNIHNEVVNLHNRIRDVESEELRSTEAKRAPEFLAAFPEEIQRVILRETFSIELTEGCSVRCTFCAFDAGGGVRDTMPFETALWIMRRVKSRAFLYYATDPLDYRSSSNGRERTYSDILDAFSVLQGTTPFTATAAPIKSMDVLRRVADRIDRVSFSKMNERRLIREGFIERTEGGTYLPTDANLAMRFWTRSDDTERHSPEIYRLTDRDNEAGASKVYVSGRQAARSHEDGHADGDAIADSIACRDGVLLSPKNARNSLRMMTTSEYPNGIAEAVLDPARLNNGFDEVRRLSEKIADGSAVIEQLLPCVVVTFAFSSSRNLKEIGDKAPAGTSRNKKTVSMPETIRFKTFRTSGTDTTSISGTCEFDRVSGKIRAIALEEWMLSSAEPMAAK